VIKIYYDKRRVEQPNGKKRQKENETQCPEHDKEARDKGILMQIR
jgi:hypothetical protein